MLVMGPLRFVTALLSTTAQDFLTKDEDHSVFGFDWRPMCSAYHVFRALVFRFC